MSKSAKACQTSCGNGMKHVVQYPYSWLVCCSIMKFQYESTRLTSIYSVFDDNKVRRVRTARYTSVELHTKDSVHCTLLCFFKIAWR